jgi:peroxidase
MNKTRNDHLHSKRRPQRRPQRQRQLETLEPRHLMAGDFRSIDGTGNNLAHPEWGSTSEAFLRVTPAEYADGLSAAAGSDRPSARAISNALSAHPEESILNERDMSAFIYAWGQFLDHDIDLTPTQAAGGESLSIAVPTGDVYFDPNSTGTKTIGLTRSTYDPATGATTARQQMNAITAFIDASQVYGSDAATANSLRTFVGGQLATSAGNLLPQDAQGFFIAGDIRANENPDLLAMQTLFMREHNRLATSYAAQHPEWTDEQLYQQSRKMVAAEVQAITYNEFLPALLGKDALSPYRGYNPSVNPGIANEFSTAAFRLGHSLLGSDIEFLDNNGNELFPAVALKDAFFNAQLLTTTGIDPILKYLASDRAEEIDTRIIDDVRNFLFGPPGSGGFDLAALNIQRGRDHGLADYNDVRAAYGLPKVTDFSQITKNVDTQNALRETYGSVDKIDVWVGGLAEDHVNGASVGSLFKRILVDQFTRLRDGDRFWYERDLKGAELDAARHASLAGVIRANTTTTNLQDNVFFFKPTINGQVYLDGNSNGALDRRETGVGNVKVELQDGSGAVVATTRTQRDGRYELEAPDLGSYTVHVTAPRGLAQSGALEAIEITTGGRTERTNVGLARLNRLPVGQLPTSTPTTSPPLAPPPPPTAGTTTSPPPTNTLPPPPPPPTSSTTTRPPAPTDSTALPPRPPLDPQMVDTLFGGTTSNTSAPRPRR